MTVEKTTLDESIAEFTWDDDDTNLVDTLDNEDATILTNDEKKDIIIGEVKEEKEEKIVEKEESTIEDEEKTKIEKEEKVDETIDFSDEAQEVVDEKVDEKDDDFFKVLASGLKEQGVFSNTKLPDENIDEEGFVGLVEDEVESRVTETFEGFFEEMDDDGKAFLKFKKEGGSTKDFFNVIKETSAVPTGDIDDENYQKRFLKYYYENIEKLDAEDTEERIEYLEENGKIEKFAKKYQPKVEQLQIKEKTALANRIKEAKQFDDESTKDFHTKLKSTLDGAETIKDFTIAKTEKNDLFNFITKPSIKVGKNKFITGLQQGLQNASKDYDTLILLAKLIKSDFDVSGIETKEKTKQVRKLKSNLQRSKKNIKPSANGGSGKSQLSDFFN
jgi:hypothetical protein